MGELAIRAEGLGKCYSIGRGGQRHDTLRDLLSEGAKSVLKWRWKSEPDTEPFWALRDANFEIGQGENVGIIGLNGAGKSTLLKILSRIVEPSAGSARVVGRVGALLEVGTGFHWELTGRENVYLYGSILGMSKQEIGRRFEEIVEFAEIEKFIDTPVKRYSSGMYVRLAFSVAAQLRPEILLLDEVLAVGDVSFQRKCIDYAKSLQRSNSTILFVSHNMFTIKTMCERVIYLRQGRVLFDGTTDRGIEIYEDDCRLGKVPWIEGAADGLPVVLQDCVVLGEDRKRKTVFDHGERLVLRLSYEAQRTIVEPNIIVAFVRSDGVAACNFSSALDGHHLTSISGKGFVELITPPIKLVAEMYAIHVIIRERTFDSVVCGQIGATFHVRDATLDTHFGVFHESGAWEFMLDADSVAQMGAEWGDARPNARAGEYALGDVSDGKY
jgi:lipopolysaccharide transport system ATP-binding protein